MIPTFWFINLGPEGISKNSLEPRHVKKRSTDILKSAWLFQMRKLYMQKNIVAAGLAERCEIQVSYAIGVAEPTSISVETFGTGKLTEDRLVQIIKEHFDLRPKGLIAMLGLLKPIYQATAAYGHFGRTEDTFSWEKTDKIEALKDAAGI